MAGNREKDWGKEKKFREGQQDQVLDTLFFDFIDLAKKLQPKVVVAENVKGLLMGEAKQYVIEIYKQFEEAGYYCQHFLLDASKMGVPQRRERVFFVCLRKDLATSFLHFADMFTEVPKIEMEFNEKPIFFEEINDITDENHRTDVEIQRVKYWYHCQPGDVYSMHHPKGHLFGNNKASFNQVLPTIVADPSNGSWHPVFCRVLNSKELCKGGSYPLDYQFKTPPKYLIGMSVPPVMTAQIASNIYDQWLSKLK